MIFTIYELDFFNTDLQFRFDTYLYNEINFSLAFSLIFIGFSGATWNQKNIVKFLLSIELLLLGISLLFISFSLLHGDHKGQIMALLILVLAGAESTLGLSILIISNRLFSSIDFNSFQTLKG